PRVPAGPISPSRKTVDKTVAGDLERLEARAPFRRVEARAGKTGETIGAVAVQTRVTLIHEHSARIRTPEGLTYAARIYGQQGLDGTWLGWIQFDPLGIDGPTLRTDR